MTSGPRLHLAVALDGTGWHPAAWREPSARPGGPVHRRAVTGSTWLRLAENKACHSTT